MKITTQFGFVQVLSAVPVATDWQEAWPTFEGSSALVGETGFISDVSRPV